MYTGALDVHDEHDERHEQVKPSFESLSSVPFLANRMYDLNFCNSLIDETIRSLADGDNFPPPELVATYWPKLWKGSGISRLIVNIYASYAFSRGNRPPCHRMLCCESPRHALKSGAATGYKEGPDTESRFLTMTKSNDLHRLSFRRQFVYYILQDLALEPKQSRLKR